MSKRPPETQRSTPVRVGETLCSRCYCVVERIELPGADGLCGYCLAETRGASLRPSPDGTETNFNFVQLR